MSGCLSMDALCLVARMGRSPWPAPCGGGGREGVEIRGRPCTTPGAVLGASRGCQPSIQTSQARITRPGSKFWTSLRTPM